MLRGQWLNRFVKFMLEKKNETYHQYLKFQFVSLWCNISAASVGPTIFWNYSLNIINLLLNLKVLAHGVLISSMEYQPVMKIFR